MNEVINTMEPENINVDVISEKPEPEVTAAPSIRTYDVEVTANALKLHKEANSKSPMVRVVRKGTVLTVLSEKAGYLNVGNAWASKKYTKRK